MWHTVSAVFEQFEAGELAYRARLDAGGPDGGRALRLVYELKQGAPSSEAIYFHGDPFHWEARAADGSLRRPSSREDAAYDHGVWSLLRPRALLAGATVARDGERLRLVPRETTRHQFPDEPIIWETNEPKAAWISAAPALYIPAASHYDAVLDDEHDVLTYLAAVVGGRPIRAWKLSDVAYDGPPPAPVRPGPPPRAPRSR